MAQSICVRSIFAAELAWVNEQYQSIEFVPSKLDDRQFVAEVNGERAGLGRLVPLGKNAYELGGIFVLPQFRGQSIARTLVEYLLLQVPGSHVYCIPFANLGDFYQQMGFSDCLNLETVPEKIRDKYYWCQQTYPQKVLLLQAQT